MAPQIGATVMEGDNLVPRAHMVEGENWPPKAVLTYTFVYMHNK